MHGRGGSSVRCVGETLSTTGERFVGVQGVVSRGRAAVGDVALDEGVEGERFTDGGETMSNALQVSITLKKASNGTA